MHLLIENISQKMTLKKRIDIMILMISHDDPPAALSIALVYHYNFHS